MSNIFQTTHKNMLQSMINLRTIYETINLMQEGKKFAAFSETGTILFHAISRFIRWACQEWRCIGVRGMKDCRCNNFAKVQNSVRAECCAFNHDYSPSDQGLCRKCYIHFKFSPWFTYQLPFYAVYIFQHHPWFDLISFILIYPTRYELCYFSKQKRYWISDKYFFHQS